MKQDYIIISKFSNSIMNNEQVISKTANFVKKRLENDTAGHDWWHVYRVWKLSMKIAKKENVKDLFVVQLAALLHDIAEWKTSDVNEDVAAVTAEKWLSSMNVDERTISHVCGIIKNISYKGAGTKSNIITKEGMVVQDADRVDAIGAVGIARTFAFGQKIGNQIYNPDIKPILGEKEYKEIFTGKRKGTTINHFYEKLLLLKDLMNTKTGKKIAQKRHKYMEKFLYEFFKEWEGKY
jgi:uncharacterized protein